MYKMPFRNCRYLDKKTNKLTIVDWKEFEKRHTFIANYPHPDEPIIIKMEPYKDIIDFGTGLTDYNDVEIFENDIVEHITTKKKFLVELKDNRFPLFFDSTFAKSVKVIGNNHLKENNNVAYK